MKKFNKFTEDVREYQEKKMRGEEADVPSSVPILANLIGLTVVGIILWILIILFWPIFLGLTALAIIVGIIVSLCA